MSVTRRLADIATPAIAPSMLKCRFGRLDEDMAALAAGGAPVLHWDVMDGHFVPNLSYGALVIESLRSQSDLYFDAHLMISEPERYIDDYLRAGCDAITFHIEAVPSPQKLIDHIRQAGRQAGLALNPKTPVERVLPYVDSLDLLLVMSVEPGFGGQKFQPEVLEKARTLARAKPATCRLSIDGGIGKSTIAQAAAAGVDLFVCGSSVFDEADYASAIHQLHHLAASTSVDLGPA